MDPYGFINETQSLSISIDSSEDLAVEIVKILLKHTSTNDRMREALYVALENSNGHKIACRIMKIIELLEDGITQDEILRIRQATHKNPWVKDAYTVKDFLERVNVSIPLNEAPF